MKWRNLKSVNFSEHGRCHALFYRNASETLREQPFRWRVPLPHKHLIGTIRFNPTRKTSIIFLLFVHLSVPACEPSLTSPPADYESISNELGAIRTWYLKLRTNFGRRAEQTIRFQTEGPFALDESPLRIHFKRPYPCCSDNTVRQFEIDS